MEFFLKRFRRFVSIYPLPFEKTSCTDLNQETKQPNYLTCFTGKANKSLFESDVKKKITESR